MNSQLSKKAQEEMLLDLWQSAVFDDECYAVLEAFVKELAKKKNTHDYSLSSQDVYSSLATVRNRNLITIEEQHKLRKTVVAFFGLSVGSHAALTWLMQSRADVMKIVDPDTIAPTNLNRLRYSWDDIGEAKVDIIEKALKAINPYIRLYSSKEKNLEAMKKLIDSNPKTDVIVDEIDDMEGKIALRKCAKERNISIISAADVGDNVVLDIERYDLSPQPELFLGRIANIEKIDFSTLSDLERKKLIIKLVGFEENSEKLLDSLLSLGKSLATWPQLGATAAITGGVITTTIKKIVLGENVQSGRYYLSLDQLLVKDFTSQEHKNAREEKIATIKKKFKLSE